MGADSETYRQLLGSCERIKAELEDVDTWPVSASDLDEAGIDDLDEYDEDDPAHDVIHQALATYGVRSDEVGISAWTDGVLEIYANARVSWDEVDIREVVLVTGTGGPHIEVVVDLNSSYDGFAVHGYWGSDHVVVRGSSAPLTSYCEMYAENLEMDRGVR